MKSGSWGKWLQVSPRRRDLTARLKPRALSFFNNCDTCPASPNLFHRCQTRLVTQRAPGSSPSHHTPLALFRHHSDKICFRRPRRSQRARRAADFKSQLSRAVGSLHACVCQRTTHRRKAFRCPERSPLLHRLGGGIGAAAHGGGPLAPSGETRLQPRPLLPPCSRAAIEYRLPRCVLDGIWNL